MTAIHQAIDHRPETVAETDINLIENRRRQLGLFMPRLPKQDFSYHRDVSIKDGALVTQRSSINIGIPDAKPDRTELSDINIRS